MAEEAQRIKEWDKITPLTSLISYTNASTKDEEYLEEQYCLTQDEATRTREIAKVLKGKKTQNHQTLFL